jgi:hypothetical protein
MRRPLTLIFPQTHQGEAATIWILVGVGLVAGFYLGHGHSGYRYARAAGHASKPSLYLGARGPWASIPGTLGARLSNRLCEHIPSRAKVWEPVTRRWRALACRSSSVLSLHLLAMQTLAQPCVRAGVV